MGFAQAHRLRRQSLRALQGRDTSERAALSWTSSRKLRLVEPVRRSRAMKGTGVLCAPVPGYAARSFHGVSVSCEIPATSARAIIYAQRSHHPHPTILRGLSATWTLSRNGFLGTVRAIEISS